MAIGKLLAKAGELVRPLGLVETGGFPKTLVVERWEHQNGVVSFDGRGWAFEGKKEGEVC